jgi:hypothetical protein
MKGKLPVTGFIELESNEAQWLMLTKGLINDLRITALIEKEPNIKVRVKIVITRILSPDLVFRSSSCTARTNMGVEISKGISRSWEYFANYISKNSWLLMGYIDSEEKVPILITHYKLSNENMSVYTQKIKSDGNFFPAELN